VIPSINCFSLFLIVVIDSSHKDSYLVSLIWNSSTFARQRVKSTCLFCRTCDHLVCADCVSYKHNKHNFEPIEKILPEKLDDLKGAEARTEYCPLLFSVVHLEIAI
jgi:hypothetical protein